MNRIVRCFAHGLFVSALACTVAVAEEPALSWQDQGGTLYISGGIGEKELDWIKNSSSDFGLRLLFAEKTGAYITGVHVVIADAKGKTVLDVGDAGPYLLVKLAAGNYRINATYHEHRQTRQASVRDGQPTNLSLRW